MFGKSSYTAVYIVNHVVLVCSADREDFHKGCSKKKLVTPFYFELRNFEYINDKLILLVA